MIYNNFSSIAKKYDIIYADPPWKYDDWKTSRGTGAVAAIYPTLDIEEIKKIPIKGIASTNCALFLWATMPKLTEALEVITAWGFEYRTCAFTWVKLNPSNFGIYSGLGYWTNGNAELCLFGKKGHPKRQERNVKQIILAPRTEHSRKPAEVRDRIVRLMGDLPRIELFARQEAEGWDCWSNQLNLF